MLTREQIERLKWGSVLLEPEDLHALCDMALAHLSRPERDAESARAEPAGMVSVPREPTQLMVDAGWEAAGHMFPSDGTLRVTWKAMLAAAKGEK